MAWRRCPGWLPAGAYTSFWTRAFAGGTWKPSVHGTTSSSTGCAAERAEDAEPARDVPRERGRRGRAGERRDRAFGEAVLRKVALIPVYNEASTVLEVLEALQPRVDLLLVVDDGSSDGSPELVREWSAGRPNVELLRLPRNRGMSSALRAGFTELAARLGRGELGPDDLLFNLDADGQHDPAKVDALADYIARRGLDVALTRRDFGRYPRYKRVGNTLMSLWGSLLAGYRYRDVESGFRGLRLEVLPPLLDYYTGRRYSCAQEIAIITARLGFRVDNDFPTPIARYRSQTGLGDVLGNAAFGLLALARVGFGLRGAARSRSGAVAAGERVG